MKSQKSVQSESKEIESEDAEKMSEEEKSEQLVSLREVEHELGDLISSVWLRRVATESEEFFTSRVKVTYKKSKMKWMFTREDVAQYKQHLLDKHARTLRIKSGQEKAYKYIRPTIYTYNKMKREIEEDAILSKEEKSLILATLERYNKKWISEYEQRAAKRPKKQTK